MFSFCALWVDEHPSFAWSPLRQMLGKGLEGQAKEDLTSSNQNTAFEVGLASMKAKGVKMRPLCAARPFRRRGAHTAAKSEQVCLGSGVQDGLPKVGGGYPRSPQN